MLIIYYAVCTATKTALDISKLASLLFQYSWQSSNTSNCPNDFCYAEVVIKLKQAGATD